MASRDSNDPLRLDQDAGSIRTTLLSEIPLPLLRSSHPSQQPTSDLSGAVGAPNASRILYGLSDADHGINVAMDAQLHDDAVEHHWDDDRLDDKGDHRRNLQMRGALNVCLPCDR